MKSVPGITHDFTKKLDEISSLLLKRVGKLESYLLYAKIFLSPLFDLPRDTIFVEY